MIYAGSPALRRPALRRARRGPLPPGRLPGPGVGGGDHPPAARRCGWCACRPRCRTPRSWPTGSRPCGARPRRSSRSAGRSSCATSTWSATGRAERLHLLPDPRRRPAQPRGRPARRRGRRGPAAAAGRGGRRPALLHARAGSRWSSGSTTSDMLPAIYFIFSRAALRRRASRRASTPACGSPTPEERAAHPGHRRGAHARRSSDADLDVLGYDRWLAGLEAGVAAHHAGMVPPFKEAVEACFAAGPGEGGVRHRDPGPRHQHAGPVGGHREAHRSSPASATSSSRRASTRSSPGGPGAGASTTSATPSCCGRRSCPSTRWPAWRRAARYALSSSFRPTYNMAANLVRRYAPDEAHHLLNLSLRPVPGRPRRRAARGPARADRASAWPRLRAEADVRAGRRGGVPRLLRAAGRAARPPGRGGDRRDRRRAVAGCGPATWSRSPGGRLAVLSVASPQGRRRCRLQAHRRRAATALTLGARRLRRAARPRSGTVELPVPYAPNNRAFQHEVADALRRARLRRRRPRRPTADPADDGRGRRPRARRPAEAPPGRRLPRPATGHLAAAGRRPSGCERELADARAPGRRGRTESLARQFDRVLRLLEAWGYLDGWALTDAGRACWPASTTSATCWWPRPCAAALFDGLDPAAARRAGLVLHLRAPRPATRPPPPWFPSRRRPRALGRSSRRWPPSWTPTRSAAGLPPTRPPDPGFVALAHAWAAGEELADVLDDEELSGGDFVRNVKQLIDLLRQLGDVAPEPATARPPARPPTRCSGAWWRPRHARRRLRQRRDGGGDGATPADPAPRATTVDSRRGHGDAGRRGRRPCRRGR